MDLADVAYKINCTLADAVYSSYLNKKYGINDCKLKYDFYDLLSLHSTKKLLDAYLLNPSQYKLDKLTTNMTTLVADPNRVTPDYPCDISKLIEKINLL